MTNEEFQQHVPLAASLADLHEADHPWDVYAQLRSVKEFKTKDGKPYLVLELADVDSVLEAKIWSDRAEAMKVAREAALQSVVKVRGRVSKWKDKVQLVVEQLRPRREGDDAPGLDLDQIVDPALAAVEDLVCKTLVFDIETVPAHDLRELPAGVVESLTTSANRKDMEPGAMMGLSPFFGQIVSLAIGDGEGEGSLEDVTVFAVPPPGAVIEAPPKWFRPVDEATLLRTFWALASRAETVVSFNGRSFDVPFLVTRSLIHGIPARVDLMSNRFGLRPHLDLFELLTQRDRGPSKLDVVCWALGIESPKQEMSGAEVAPAYARGEILKIAEYNAHDVRATSAVYRRLRDLVLRYRADWSGSRG